MRSLNVRLLAIIVGVGVLLAIFVFALNRFQVYRHANFFYRTAQRTKDSDDLEQQLEAVKNYRRYVSLCPDDNDVRAELGELLADIAKKGGPRLRYFYGDAFFAFEHVLRDDSIRSDVRRKLVEAIIAARARQRFSDAKEHLEVLLQDSPNDAELLRWMGQCQASDGEDRLAIESFKKAIENAPQQIETYTLLALLLKNDVTLRGDRDLTPTVEEPVSASTAEQTTGESGDAGKTTEDESGGETGEDEKSAVNTVDNTAKATVEKEDENHPDTWMNRMVKANPRSPRAHLIRGQYLRRTHKPDEARQDAADALKNMPEAMKSTAASLRNTAKALEDLEKSLPSPPTSTKQAVDGLKSVALQLETASQDAARLAENKDCTAVEDAVAKPLNETADILRTAGKSLSEIAAENERDDIVETLAAAVDAKDELEEDFNVMCESLQGSLLLLTDCEAAKMEKDMEKDNAMRFALRAFRFFPKSANIYSTLSQLESFNKNGEAARVWVDRGLDATDEAPELLWKKANFLIEDLGKPGLGAKSKERILDKLADVTERLQSSFSRYGMPPFINYLSARAAYVQGQWAKASSLFEAIRTDLAHLGPRLAKNCDQMAAVCYDRLSRPELARDARSRARTTPGAVAGRFGTIAKMLAQGKAGEAIAEVDKMRESGNLPKEAWIILAQNNLGVNRSREKSKQDWDTFYAILQEAKEHNPDDPRLVAIAADAFVAQEQLDAAIKLLDEECKKNPGELKLWQSLVRVAIQKEDWALAQKSLDGAQEQLGDTVDLRILRAIFVINRDKEQASAELQKLAEPPGECTNEEKARLWSVLAACARQADDLGLAQRLCLKAADGDPTNLRLRIFLFDIANRKKDDKAMAEAVQEIHKIEMEGPLWHYYEAVRLATGAEKENDQKDFDKALEHLAQAKILRPNWDRAPMLAGRIQLRKGDKESAMENFIDAVSNGSRDPEGIGLLVNLLYEQGRNEEAQRYINMLEDKEAQLSAHTKRLQAQDMLMRGELKEGLQHFRQIADNSDDFRDHLRLGQILAAFAQQARLADNTERTNTLCEDAEKSLRKAVQLAPDEEAPRLSLVQFLNRFGKESEALQAIIETRNTVSKERLPLVLALCYQSLGRGSEAEQQFLTAVANSDGKDHAARYLADFYLRNKKYDEAEKMLTRMIDAEQKASEDDVAWARRREAILLYSKGGLSNRRDAIALIDENLKINPASVLDMREKARLLATFSNKKDREEARKLLEKLLSRPNPNPEDRFLMANILLIKDDWPGVTRQMRQLLAMEKVKPIWLEFYVGALLDRDELGDANSYLNRLERIKPYSNAVAKFKAVLLARRNRYEQVVSTLDRYVENPSAAAEKNLTSKEIEQRKIVRLANAANVLERIIDTLPTKESGSDPKKIAAARLLTGKAEQYWRQIAELHPEGTLRLVRFLSKFGKRDEALSIAETAWKKSKPSTIATTVVSLIVMGEATPQQVQRVERILNDSIITLGETNSLLLAMAELRSIQRRYEEAEAMYRKVLEKDPRHMVALNNLAVFLALRNIKQDESLEMIDLAISNAGPKPVLLDSRASVYLSRGQWQRALDDLDVAIAGKPTATRLFHQALALQMGKQTDKAKRAFKRAHNLGLNVNNLQPLERPAYRQLREVLQ